MKNKLLISIFLLIPLFSFNGLNPVDNIDATTGGLEIYLYKTGSGDELDGETQNAHFDDEKALDIKNLGFSTSNNVYLGSSTGGLSAGKASGNALTFTTRASRAIPELYKALCTGSHFGDIIIPIGFSTSGMTALDFGYREKIELKLVMVSDVEVSSIDPATGEVEYKVTLGYGAIRRTMYEVDESTGGLSIHDVVQWSYVLDDDIFAIQ